MSRSYTPSFTCFEQTTPPLNSPKSYHDFPIHSQIDDGHFSNNQPISGSVSNGFTFHFSDMHHPNYSIINDTCSQSIPKVAPARTLFPLSSSHEPLHSITNLFNPTSTILSPYPNFNAEFQNLPSLTSCYSAHSIFDNESFVSMDHVNQDTKENSIMAASNVLLYPTKIDENNAAIEEIVESVKFFLYERLYIIGCSNTIVFWKCIKSIIFCKQE